ncbi:MAG: hypothetical protein LH614_22805 [Pyrinomonadaceae bacterium]|nr:hypothetical protein [Pyrinomonadaceae bacterium]
MNNAWLVKTLLTIFTVLLLISGIVAQNTAQQPPRSREISEDDGIPVLTKHLPDWENTRNRVVYVLNKNDLQNALGSRPILDLIEFESGTEAVTATYEPGKLLLVEYTTPQASSDADIKINQKLLETGQNQTTVYRRIGNYNAFVFDSTDQTAANLLLDQIKYEKNVQWLGADPFMLKRAERALVKGLSEVFVATVYTIVGGIGIAILLGLTVGFIYFRVLEQKRSTMQTFSDAGGMTRLNLDGFTPEITPSGLLNK